MKLKVQYTTNERKYHSESTYSNVPKMIEVEPLRIIRNPLCRYTSRVQRYSYRAVYEAPNDAEFKYPDGTCQSNIVRKSNPHFNPKKLTFNGATCELKDNV